MLGPHPTYSFRQTIFWKQTYNICIVKKVSFYQKEGISQSLGCSMPARWLPNDTETKWALRWLTHRLSFDLIIKYRMFFFLLLFASFGRRQSPLPLLACNLRGGRGSLLYKPRRDDIRSLSMPKILTSFFDLWLDSVTWTWYGCRCGLSHRLPPLSVLFGYGTGQIKSRLFAVFLQSKNGGINQKMWNTTRLHGERCWVLYG